MRISRKMLALIFVLTMTGVSIRAQESRGWESYFDELASFDEETAAAREETYDILCDLEEHPININTATREDLERLPFLSDSQIQDICEYIYRYGPLKTIGELQMIGSLDYNRRHLMQSFVYAGDDGSDRFPALRDIIKQGRHELLATARIPLYERKGDRNGYLGYKYKHWVRYTFSHTDRLRAGLTASQDAGEPLFAEKNTLGYDHYSLYIQMNRLGRIETLVLGTYKLSFGMGLVMNNGFSMGKLAALSSLGRATASVRASSSRSAADYLQGAAATVRIARTVTASAFVSYRPLDATLNKKDSTVATIVTSGYHRTPAEMEKKNNTHSAATGMNVRWTSNGLHIGATAVYTHFDRELRPKTETLYRRYYPAGNDFMNAGIDYGYVCHRFAVNGETAVNRDGSIATINTISASLSESISLMLLQRFYSYRYTSLYANSFSDAGSTQNESGIYAGAEWRPAQRLRIAAYTDFAWSAWPRYQISWPSHSFDNMLSASYSGNGWTADTRYRIRIRQKDNEDKTALTNRTEHRARAGVTICPSARWQCRTQADFSLARHNRESCGFMVSQSAGYDAGKIQLYLSANYFDTDNYDSRLYAYERGTTYSFSFPAFHGNGMRCALMARADILRNLTVTAKAGMTLYFDRDTIGSGYQTVDGRSMTDIDVQLRWRL